VLFFPTTLFRRPCASNMPDRTDISLPQTQQFVLGACPVRCLAGRLLNDYALPSRRAAGKMHGPKFPWGGQSSRT
jgi:hypothetical protein